MFCPSCGAHQTGERRFCTSCGQNLLLVSQALGGHASAASQRPSQIEIARQQDLAKGVKLTIIGGAFLAIQFFSFIFSLPFRNSRSPFGFLSFVALILMAIGVSKLVNARPVVARNQPVYHEPPVSSLYSAAPAQLAINPEVSAHPDAPATGELVDTRHPGPSVTEEDTRHLPGHAPTQKQA